MARKPIAYVQAAWHTEITDHCRTAFTAEMAKHGYGAADIQFFSVPGSLEIPLMARKLAQTGRYAAVCASGLVVNGGIYRHDFVAQAVLHGIVQTSLDTEVPVLSAVLAPHHFHEQSSRRRARPSSASSRPWPDGRAHPTSSTSTNTSSLSPPLNTSCSTPTGRKYATPTARSENDSVPSPATIR